MWRWIFVNLLVFSATSTQPISEHDGRECCPCPKPGVAPTFTGNLPRSNFMDGLSNQGVPFTRAGGADQDLAGTTGEGSFVRASGVDDCPCRFRDTDSVGAPSILFPSAMRAIWPVVSDKDTSQDAKPLLHPEVGFASSVLETLREATDEEYQEALARDAVRSALQAPDVMSDVSSALDTARNIVNVILKPNDSFEGRDDTESKASHVQESRCIHPLGRANNLNLQYSPLSINKIFDAPKREPTTLLHKNRNFWDMDSNVGASDVHEQIIDGTGSGLQKLKSTPALFNLFPDKNKDATDESLKFKPFKDNSKTFNDFKEATTSEGPLEALTKKIDNSLSDLKLKLDNHLKTIKDDNADRFKSVFDNVNSASTNNFALKPKKFEFTTIKPLPLKSLLNLKDVELIPPIKTWNDDFNKARSNIPELIIPNQKRKESKDLFESFKSVDLGELIANGLKIGFKNSNNKGGTENIQPIPKKLFRSGIMDADTSPSEVKLNLHHKARDNQDCNYNKSGVSSEEDQSNIPEAKDTEILETLPKSPTEMKLNMNSVPTATIECKTTNIDPINSNNNDLPKNINSMPHTEIIDTVPSPSKIYPVEIANENNCNAENFNEVTRDNAGIETGSLINDSSEDKDSDESDDESINNENISQESNMEQREQKFDCSEDVSKHQDVVPETSNILPNVVEPENNRADLISSNVNDDSNEVCVDENSDKKINLDTKDQSNFPVMNPLFKKTSLSSLTADILHKIDKLKKPTNKMTDDRKKENIISDVKNAYCDGDETTVPKAEKHVNFEKTPSKALDIEDLQNMSDKLLDLSVKKDQETFASENIQCDNEPDSKTTSEQIQDHIIENINARPLEEITEKTLQNVDTPDDDDSVTTYASEKNDRSDESIENKKTCSSGINQISDSVPENNMKNEMTADGSDPVANKIIPDMQRKSSLLHNILNPKPLCMESGLKGSNLKLKNILNLKLPSLDLERGPLASILEPKDNIEMFLDEKGKEVDSNIMSADASAPSTSTLQTMLPSLQPLEDINLDIFQLRPLRLPDPQDILSQISSLPKLNMNSYKAKLAVPKGLNLKPMKLESSLGGKNGLFGATLTIGSDKGSFTNRPKVLGGPFSLNNLPTLEEIHSNMRENAQNLLLTPLDITGRNMIDDSLRSSQTLTDNLRSHAKNTMKDIQQTIQTRLKDVEQSDLSILADPLKDPQEFLQAVSRTHDDVTDKLKAIHYDLNDRLESFRDRITDQSLLPTLHTPMMRQNSLTFGPEKLSMSSYRKPQKKLKASSKSRPQTSSKATSSRTKSAKSKTLRMPTAPSVPVPKTVAAPILKTIATPSPPPFVLKDPIFRTPQLLTNKKSITEIFQEPVSRFRQSKIPVLGKFKPTENKVKISFGPTTLRPDISKNKPSLATRLNNRPSVAKNPTLSSKVTSPVNSGSRRIGSKLRPFSDAHVAPSEMVSTKVVSPDNVEETNNKPSLTIANKPFSDILRPKSLSNKPKPHVNDKSTNGHSRGPVFAVDRSIAGSESKFLADPKLGVPKNMDIITSLREAVRARLSNLTPITNNKIVQPGSILQPDMLRSASENVESTNVDGVMRENASYTCKMVCTRNK